jgi:hypothetical protein
MAYTDLDKPSDYFNTVLYTGNAGTQSITGVGFQPDFFWGKSRSNTKNNALHDSVRGVTVRLISNTAAAEATVSASVTAFGSDGFTLGSDTTSNASGNTFVAWNWKGGTTASGTTGGSGTGKPYAYSASPASGFSVVTFTGNATAGHLIPHGMGKVPKMIHIKSRADDNGWTSGVSVAGGFNDHGYLYLTNAFGTDANQFGGTHTTTNIRLGTGTGTNGNNGTRVAYCFADVQGYQKIGEYTGNGNADGTFIYLGFKPAWFMLKKTSAADPWLIYDNKRSPINQVQANLQANTSNVEVTNTVYLDFLSNGVKLRNTDNDGNLSGGTFIYLAIAENPLVTSTGVPATAR